MQLYSINQTPHHQRQTGLYTDKQAHKQTNRTINRQTDLQTEKQTHIQTNVPISSQLHEMDYLSAS